MALEKIGYFALSCVIVMLMLPIMLVLAVVGNGLVLASGLFS